MTALYCTPDDVRNAVCGAQPVDTGAKTGTAADLTDDQINLAVEQASSMISSYVGTDYEVDASNPTVTVPQLVWSLTVDFSAYYATLMYRKGKSLDEYDPVYLRYQNARATFADLTSGKIQVSPNKPNEGSSLGGRVINTVPGVFTPRDSGSRITNGNVRPEGYYDSHGMF